VSLSLPDGGRDPNDTVVVLALAAK